MGVKPKVTLLKKLKKWYMETKSKIKDFNEKTCKCVREAKKKWKTKCLAMVPRVKKELCK